ncbi:hypothetical protein Y10_17610 [Neptunitalea sp. Y10]|uniref:Uncharacterized protein n=1 Tax=Neptunitalea lumnitzerae TaxID=2965509 RepID=A0ABQ5MJ23_9FLAO|nr:hypothetical protein [Neptunitalea sp. Y10]GLB49393.1 hypothetical protein Y10_17610 [Neptunitalea sp. Y10]
MTYITLNKNNHIALILTVLVFFLKLGVCYSQHSIDVTHISLVVYNKTNTDLRLFEEKEKNQFVEVFLEFDSNFDNNFISTNIEQDHVEHTLTLEDIKRNEKDVLVHTDSLRDLNNKDVKKDEYEIIENWYKYGEKTNALVLKFLNTHISTIQELSFQKREQNVGIGTHVLTKDDTENRWSVSYTNYFATVDLNFGNNKHIYLLINHDDINYIFLPLINTNYLISDNDGISALKPTSKYKTSYKENFEQMEFENFTPIAGYSVYLSSPAMPNINLPPVSLSTDNTCLAKIEGSRNGNTIPAVPIAMLVVWAANQPA